MIRLMDILFFLLSFTLTFDLILNFEFLGFTVRLAHFLSIFFFGAVAYTRWKKGLAPIDFKTPLTFPILLYLVVASFSLTQTGFLAKSIGYLIWAVFDFLIIFLGVVNYININKQRISKVIRIHLLSYILVCIFGLIQIFSPALGFSPLITQWLPNGIPRINAFFYEPCPFAFFVIQGIIIFGIILLSGQKLYSNIPNFPIFALMVTACFLSSSRSGWLALGGFSLIAGYLAIRRKALNQFIKATVAIALIALCTISVLNKLYSSQTTLEEEFLIMAQKGIDPHEKSSSSPRLLMMLEGLKIFSINPWLGVGLGGYGDYIYNNLELKMVDEPKRTDPHSTVTPNLWIEVLAETGLLGFLCLLFILWTFVKTSWQAIQSHNSPDISCYIMGYLIAVLVIFGISYQFNQTLFRTDVWLLLGIGTALSSALNTGLET